MAIKIKLTIKIDDETITQLTKPQEQEKEEPRSYTINTIQLDPLHTYIEDNDEYCGECACGENFADECDCDEDNENLISLELGDLINHLINGRN